MKLNIVRARVGILWFKEGLRTFWRQPLALSALFFMYAALISVMGMVPYLGVALSLALLPTATLGMMAATKEAEQGRFPMPTLLLSAWRAGHQQARNMAILGAIYAVAFLLIMGVSALIDGGTFARMVLLGTQLTPESAQSPTLAIASLVALGLYVPFSMLFWHAPALVHWHALGPVQSLFYSGVACTRNFWPLTLYTLAWSGLFIVVTICIVVLSVSLESPTVLVGLMLPVMMLLGAMFFTSVWYTFRDSFIVSDDPPAMGLNINA